MEMAVNKQFVNRETNLNRKFFEYSMRRMFQVNLTWTNRTAFELPVFEQTWRIPEFDRDYDLCLVICRRLPTYPFSNRITTNGFREYKKATIFGVTTANLTFRIGQGQLQIC